MDGFVDVLALEGISLQSVTFSDPFAWLLIVFGAFVMGALLWMILGSLRQVFGLHSVRCPRDGRRARIVVRQDRKGRAVAVEGCSLVSPPRSMTCGAPCLGQVLPPITPAAPG